MVTIKNYELKEEPDGYTLVVYLNPELAEFSGELGLVPKKRESLNSELSHFVRQNFPKLKIKSVKVMAGSILVTSLFLGANAVSAQSIDDSQQIEYSVQEGDTLETIASQYNISIDTIQSLNNLTSTNLSNGQKLILPIQEQEEMDSTLADQAPLILTLTPSGIINKDNQQTYRVEGHIQGNTEVEVTIQDKNNTTITRNLTATDGNFESTFDVTQLADGAVTIRAVISNDAGQKAIQQVTVEKDTVLKAAPTIENHALINSQNQDYVEITGSAEANANVKLTIKDKKSNTVWNGKADENGKYAIPVNFSSHADGDITVHIQQTDSAGNRSPIHIATFVKNTQPPTVLLNKLVPVHIGNATNYLFEGITDNHTTVSITITDGVTTLETSDVSDAQGNFSLPMDLSSLKDGNIDITIQSTNQYDNKGKTITQRIIKDTIAPQLNSLTMDDSVHNKNQGNFVIRGTTNEQALTVKLRITDNEKTITKEVKAVGGSFQFNLNLSTLKDGILTINMTNIDAAGNVTELEPKQIEKHIEIAPPSIARSGYAIAGDGSTVYNLAGISEPSSIITLKIKDSQGNVVKTMQYTVNESGVFNFDVSLAGLDLTRNYSFHVNQANQYANQSEVISPTLNMYHVQKGDTLTSIAKKYNTTVEAIRSINRLTNDTIAIDQQLKLPVTASTTVSLGYLYFGDVKNFTNQVLKTERAFNVVAPSYFDINQDGTLRLTHLVDRTFINNMHQQGIRVVPFLSNHWDRNVGRAILANRELAARQIADAIMQYNLDGVNVDLENINDADRENFTDFIRILRGLLPASKEVSVAVAANPNGWTLGWHGAYDYQALAQHADYIMMMTYDESYEGSNPGSVASYDWVERSIQYAIKQNVPKEKIVMGLAQYGRFWSSDGNYKGRGISNYVIQEMLDKYEYTLSYDLKTQSSKAIITIKEGDPNTYIGGKALSPGTYTIWFEDARSYQAKISLVDKYDIHGVGHWSIGQENKAIWNAYPTWFMENANATVIPVSNVEDTNTTTHTVIAGDTLWGIANKYQISVEQLKSWNSLTKDTIFAGQVLRITAP